MKTVFIVAGFDIHVTAATERYSLLESGLKKKGYKVVAVDISWRQKTPSQYATEFIVYYNERKSEENIVIGNSFGAVIAFITAPILKPSTVYICSLSPFFREDRGKRPDNYGITSFGIRRMHDLWSLSSDAIAQEISDKKVRVNVLFGELEHQTSPGLVERCVDTASKIKRSKLIEIPNAPHSMEDRAYSSKLVELL